MPAQLKYIVLSILFVLASVNFTRTALDIVQNSKRLEDLHSDVASLQKQQSDLNASISYKQSVDYIEERARDALNLIKPNEQAFVVPQGAGVLAAEDTKPVILSTKQKQASNFQMWMQLFLN
ncbi:MAG TPA: septum formation initiator family protein [Candidatus Saccharimonadales bacterium]|nr:septum formation initiator family protein [Candidatus Saccharimonadales bacterium]